MNNKIIIEARLLSRNTGISGFFDPLLQRLIKNNPKTKFVLTTESYKNLSITNHILMLIL